jgi:DNA-binding IclR family transcriptional regulator
MEYSLLKRNKKMSQQDVLNILKKSRKWMLTKEIAEKAGITPSNTLRALNKLKKERLVIYKLHSKYHQAKLWRIVDDIKI